MSLEDIMLDIARQINTAKSYSHVEYKMAKLIESESKTVVTRCCEAKDKKKKEDVDQKDIILIIT